jgi:glycosyltransferase involved in cell wall biosynthesis/MoaA/NifB/PqqE/SkfB family radical SAM enzyme
MNILKIIHGYPPKYNAGSEVYSQSVCNELSKCHSVSVFTREENPFSADLIIRQHNENNNLNLYFVNNPHSKDRYRLKQMDDNFAELIKLINPDIAHIGHLSHLSTGLIDELNKQKIPIVFTLHDFWLMCPRGQFLTREIGVENNYQLCSGQEDHKCASKCYKVYFGGKDQTEGSDTQYWSNWVHERMKETKSIIEKVDFFIAPSKYLHNRFVEEFAVPKSKIVCLDYGFPTEYLRPEEPSLAHEKFTFGYIGTHIPAKGINILIEAFKQIKQPCMLKIFGRENGQYTASLKLLAMSSKNQIEFSGEYINENLADTVFSNVDCIVVPSIWAENSPLVIHEAQACQIPVITADYGGMKEYVHHKINGLLFEHRNVSSLTEQMQFAIDNPNLMRQIGKRGYLYSTDGTVLNIQDHCNELVNIYSHIINSKQLWRITIDTNPEDCNLNCIMCEEHSPYSDFIPSLYKETGIKRRRMNFEIVERIIGEAAQLGIKELIPSTMGEPLLYKHFEKIFELSARNNIKINLTTNGTFPKKSVWEWARLIVPNTSDIKFSVNGATKETAEKVMLGLDFDKTISNIKEFIRYRDEYFEQNGYFCRVTFQLTFMQNNMHELSDIIKLAASIGVDRVKGHQLWTHFDEIKDLSMKATASSIQQWNSYIKDAYDAQEKYRKPNGEKVILENIIPLLSSNDDVIVPEDFECPFLNKELWVSATGKISPCCAPDKLRQTLGDFGNYHETSFADVMKSKNYQNLVVNYKSHRLCRSCNMRRPLRENA